MRLSLRSSVYQTAANRLVLPKDIELYNLTSFEARITSELLVARRLSLPRSTHLRFAPGYSLALDLSASIAKTFNEQTQRPTPKYRRAPTKKVQRTRSEGWAKDQRRRLHRKTAPLPKMSARYGGSTNKNANHTHTWPLRAAPRVQVSLRIKSAKGR